MTESPPPLTPSGPSSSTGIGPSSQSPKNKIDAGTIEIGGKSYKIVVKGATGPLSDEGIRKVHQLVQESLRSAGVNTAQNLSGTTIRERTVTVPGRKDPLPHGNEELFRSIFERNVNRLVPTSDPFAASQTDSTRSAKAMRSGEELGGTGVILEELSTTASLTLESVPASPEAIDSEEGATPQTEAERIFATNADEVIDLSGPISEGEPMHTRADLLVCPAQVVTAGCGRVEDIRDNLMEKLREAGVELDPDTEGQLAATREGAIKALSEYMEKLSKNPLFAGDPPDLTAEVNQNDPAYGEVFKEGVEALEKNVREQVESLLDQFASIISASPLPPDLKEEISTDLRAKKATVEGDLGLDRWAIVHSNPLWNGREHQFEVDIGESGEMKVTSSFRSLSKKAYSSGAPRNREIKAGQEVPRPPNFWETKLAGSEGEVLFQATRSSIPVEFDQKDQAMRSEVTRNNVKAALDAHVEAECRSGRDLTENSEANPIVVEHFTQTLLTPDRLRFHAAKLGKLAPADNERKQLNENIEAHDYWDGKVIKHTYQDENGQEQEVWVKHEITYMNVPNNTLYEAVNERHIKDPDENDLAVAKMEEKTQELELQIDNSIAELEGQAEVLAGALLEKSRDVQAVREQISEINRTNAAKVKEIHSAKKEVLKAKGNLESALRKLPQGSDPETDTRIATLREKVALAEEAHAVLVKAHQPVVESLDQLIASLTAARSQLGQMLDDAAKSDDPQIRELGKSVAKRENVRTLLSDIKEIRECGFGNNPDALEGNRSALAARTAMLAFLLGMQVQFGCRSGKDRTGIVDIEIKLLAALAAENGGLMPSYLEQERSSSTMERRQKMYAQSGNLENVAANYGGRYGLNLHGQRKMSQKFPIVGRMVSSELPEAWKKLYGHAEGFYKAGRRFNTGGQNVPAGP